MNKKMENLIYLYGLVPKKEIAKTELPSLTSFDDKGILHKLPINGSTAIVCELNEDEYSEEIIENKIDNDMEWLKKKAFHHHETIATLDKYYTLIPLKFCTIYKSEENLKEAIQEVDGKVMETFNYLENKEEWTVKIYSDDKKLKEKISKDNEKIEEKRKEIRDLPRGRRFFEEKRIDSLVDKELENEKTRIGEDLHENLKKYAIDYTIKKNWGKDITGLQEDMIWNSVYLIPEDKVESFTQEIENHEKNSQDDEWRVEAAGPWPAYHFSSFY